MALENKFDVSEELITLSMWICPTFAGAVLKQVLGWDVRLLLWIGKMCSTGYFIHTCRQFVCTLQQNDRYDDNDWM